MTLRKKTLLIITVTICSLITLFYGLSRLIILRSFANLETQDVLENVQRASDALANELAALDRTVLDWAAWDDTYAFIADGNAAYREATLNDESIATLHVNVICYIDANGQVVLGQGFDWRNEVEQPLPASFPAHLTPESLLLQHPVLQGSVKGILLLREGPLLLASRAILTSKKEGPSRGTLLMGRFLDAAQIEAWAQMTHLTLRLQPFAAAQLPPDFAAARAALSQQAAQFVQPLSAESIAGYALLNDIYGQPSLILRVEEPRAIYAQGQTSLRYVLAGLLLTGGALALVMVLVLEKTVLRRLAKLNASVSRIRDSRDLKTRLIVTGADELTNLAGTLNQMLNTLERSQRQVVESEENFRQLAENINDVFFLTDLQTQRMIYVNPAYEAIWGRSRERLYQDARFFVQAIVPADRARFARAFALHRRGKKAINAEYRIRRPDGTQRQIWVRASYLSDARGQPYRSVGLVEDITERKQMEDALRHSEAHNRALLNALPDLMFHLQADGTFLAVHGSREQLYVEPANIVGNNVQTLLPPEIVTLTMNAIRQTLATEGVQVYEYQLPMPQGVLTFEARMVAAGAAEVIALVRDVTARKRTETELQRAKDAAEAANRAKTAFLANISHEFRTPLNGILGYAQILKQSSPLTESQRNGLEIIERSGNRLLHLITEILDLTKIEAHPTDLNETELALPAFLASIIELIRLRANQKGLALREELSPALPPLVRVDEQRLRQVLMNLLTNAIKFTERGEVTLRVESVGRWGDREVGSSGDGVMGTTSPHLPTSPTPNLRFEVSDTGIGIPAERREDIFTPFTQLADYLKKSEGTGLGLTISRKLARMLGGELHVTSTLGQGSTFWFELALPEVRRPGFTEPSRPEIPVNGAASGEASAPLTPPPPEVMAALRQLAEIGDIMELRRRAEQLWQEPALRPFAGELKRFAQNIQLDEMLRFLQMG